MGNKPHNHATREERCEGGMLYLHSRIDDKSRVKADKSNDLNGIPLSNSHERQNDLKHSAGALAL